MIAVRGEQSDERTLPTFFVAGAMKAGTTALYQYLRQHPDVFMPRRKEPEFFSSRVGDAEWGGPDRGRSPRLSRAEYSDLFAEGRDHRARGEASPTYLCDRPALERLRETVPHAKLILSLRHPVDRAYSAWLMKCRHQLEHLGFEEGLEAEPRRIAEGWRYAWHYAALGRYRDQLEHCYRLFSPEQIKVVLFDDLTKDTTATIRDLFRFLDVDDTFSVDFSVQTNPAHLVRTPALERWMITPNRFRVRAHQLVPWIARPLWEWLKRVNTTPAPRLDPEVRTRLTREWDPEIVRLQEFLGRDLSAWRAQPHQPPI